MNLYIIGPVTGIEGDNRQAYLAAMEELKNAGHQVDIPHKWVMPGCSWNEAMSGSIRRMMSIWSSTIGLDNDFAIAMLDGWDNSKGAKIEHDLAEALGIPCKPWREWL